MVAAAKNPRKLVDLQDTAKNAGYPSKIHATLHTQVFAATKQDPAVARTAAGYALKA